MKQTNKQASKQAKQHCLHTHVVDESKINGSQPCFW
jgi:hypothetical protein